MIYTEIEVQKGAGEMARSANGKGAVETRIRLEDDGAVFAAAYPAIVPVLIEEYRGKIELEVYTGAKERVLAHLDAYGDRLFSEKSLLALASSLDSYIEENGYRRDRRASSRLYNSYELHARAAEGLIRPDSHRLTEILLRERVRRNDTTFSLKELLEKELPAFVTLVDGAVVSIAAINEQAGGGAIPEITVETAVAARRHGFALSNVAALANYILSQGSPTAYCCRTNHTASNRIARRAGFEPVGRFYALTAYRVPGWK